MLLSKVTAIIAAAGQGKRMGAGHNKQYLQLMGKPIIIHTLKIFQQSDLIDNIILVIPEAEITHCKQILSSYDMNGIDIVAGGKERQDSVYNGLLKADTAEIVVVHDGARPLLALNHLEKIVTEAKTNKAAILAVPVKDTIKVANPQGIIQNTPNRSSLWAAQTPQAFKRQLLMKAYQIATADRYYGTDDASLVERLGEPVIVVSGSYENIKVTTPDDLIIAEAILQRREEQCGWE